MCLSVRLMGRGKNGEGVRMINKDWPPFTRSRDVWGKQGGDKRQPVCGATGVSLSERGESVLDQASKRAKDGDEDGTQRKGRQASSTTRTRTTIEGALIPRKLARPIKNGFVAGTAGLSSFLQARKLYTS